MMVPAIRFRASRISLKVMGRTETLVRFVVAGYEDEDEEDEKVK